MKNTEFVSKDYIFTKDDEGKLTFKGDFENFYKDCEDPWGQSGNDERLKDYYKFSRKRIVDAINNLHKNTKEAICICEIGSGLGYVCDYLKQSINHESCITGIDISATAVNKSRSMFGSNIDFFHDDITSSRFLLKKKQNILLLNQVFWYLLENLDTVFENISKSLNEHGHIIISLTFLRNQMYGNDIIEGFNGMVKYFKDNEEKLGFKLLEYNLDESKKYIHDDGILILQKI